MTGPEGTADPRPTEKTSAFAQLSESAQAVGTVAGTAAGLVAFVYLLGGAVMWLRFHTADLPPDEAVAAMSREALLTVGLRVIVLPALVAGGLAMALVAFTRASSRHGFPKAQARDFAQRVRKQLARPRRKPRKATGAPTARPSNRRTTRRRHRFWKVAIAVVVLLALVLPFSVGGLVWLTLLFVLIYWWRGFGFEFREPTKVSRIRLAVVVIAVAAIISLGRQFDEPVQLLEAQIELAETKPVESVEGVLVSVDKDRVFVGDREDGTIRSLRPDELSKVVLGPPIEYAPNASILSRIVGGGRWSITPVGLWCDGVRYGWFRLGDRCKGSPRTVLNVGQTGYYVVPDPRAKRSGAGIIDVWVRCPSESPHNCNGYARLTTVNEYGPDALGSLARPRRLPLPPLREDATEFSIEPNRTWSAQVPIRLIDWTTLATKRALNQTAPLQPVPMKITLSADPRGKSVYTEAVHDVFFGEPPALPKQPPAKRARALRDR